MKILLLVPYFHPEPNAAAVRATAFAKYFTREGAEVEVMTSQTTNMPAASLDGIPISGVESYDNVRTQHGIVESIAYFPRSLRKLRARMENARPDIIMTTTPSPFLAFEGNLECKRLKIPIIFDVRDTWLVLSLTHRGRLSNYIKRKIEGQCCWGAERVLAVTSMIADQLVQEHELPRERIMLAPNGADLENFNVPRTPEFDIAILGAPSTYRDLENVFTAFSHLLKRRPSTTIVYLGWVKTDHTRYLEAVATNLGIRDKLELRPPVPHSDVPGVLAKARIGLVSLSDDKLWRASAPVKAYEYMAAGLPLACLGPSADCELRRLWHSTQAGIYESDPMKFAERLAEVLDNGTLLASMGKRAKKASVLYDRKTVARRVYRDVIVPIVEGGRGAE